ncbi:hypothetical protein GQ54DRAFT_295694 [Martensiomyces pterosporus]|nr:hypothetical protein GQ54DRAFT_295694 [Martensiomyces pterosporus]
MDYSRSRMRLGSGPQMVKTYGRFRQRMVNRDAKIAEEFTKAAGARPNITDILDTLSSDSDFEPARPTESPLPGLEPKVEPKTKSRPKSKPRTKMQAGEKSKLLADNVSDAMAEPAIAETRKPSASGRRSRPSATTSRNQEEAPEQPAARANNKTTQAMDRSSTTKPEISEPKVEQTKSQVPEMQRKYPRTCTLSRHAQPFSRIHVACDFAADRDCYASTTTLR